MFWQTIEVQHTRKTSFHQFEVYEPWLYLEEKCADRKDYTATQEKPGGGGGWEGAGRGGERKKRTGTFAAKSWTKVRVVSASYVADYIYKPFL